MGCDPFSIQDAEVFIGALHQDWGEAHGHYDELRFFTGLRPSEEIALVVTDYDAARGVLSVTKARVNGIDQDVTKTSEDRRITRRRRRHARPSGTRLPAISVPSSDPREQKPVAKGPDDVVLGARADSRYGDHEDKYAHNDHRLCRQRPDVARGTADRRGLPLFAEPSGKPSENVAETTGLCWVPARNSMVLRVYQHNGEN
jgi:hypothetical protein